MDVVSIITENLLATRRRIADAAERGGRSADEVRLVAVTKTRPAHLIHALLAAGQRILAENRIQEALPKIAQIAAEAPADQVPEWHLIGHLQTNKARQAAESFALIHSVDSERLLLALDMAAGRLGRKARALIQVNVASEQQKSGCASWEARALFDRAESLEWVQLEGLMAMAPLVADPELARPTFQGLRRLRDQLLDAGVRPERLKELSMGMSSDFEVAVEEGATLTRIGSALFRGVEDAEGNRGT